MSDIWAVPADPDRWGPILAASQNNGGKPVLGVGGATQLPEGLPESVQTGPTLHREYTDTDMQERLHPASAQGFGRDRHTTSWSAAHEPACQLQQ